MDDVVEFFRAFVAAEHAAVLAYHLEPSVAVLRETLRNAHAHFHITPKNILAIQPSGRFQDLTDAQLAEARASIGNYRYAPRTLFLIERFVHKEHGDVFVGYVSDKQQPPVAVPSRFADRLIAKRIDGALKIFAIQSVDPFAKDASNRLTWVHGQGTRMTGLTKPTAVAKLEVPGEPLSLAYYDAR